MLHASRTAREACEQEPEQSRTQNGRLGATAGSDRRIPPAPKSPTFIEIEIDAVHKQHKHGKN